MRKNKERINAGFGSVSCRVPLSRDCLFVFVFVFVVVFVFVIVVVVGIVDSLVDSLV